MTGPAIALKPLFFLLFSLQILEAAGPPLVCPAGTPLGRFELTVAPPTGGVPRDIQTVNRILPGDRISYRPIEIDAPGKKKVRIELLLVPSDGSKIVVFDPQPGDKAASWTVPFRTQLASLVWGPEGLDKAKVASLVIKNDELIGQLADYAGKTAETQALIQAISQQRALDTGQDVDAAVVGFASKYPWVTLDRTQPTDVQLGFLLRSVNPSLSAYDPLAQNPQQQAAQSAGLAAAVAGLFFGNNVGIAATGGALLVNLHSVLFPRTEFLSALAQAGSPAQSSGGADGSPPRSSAEQMAEGTGLCGSKAPTTSRTELAFLWAMRFPDAAAPGLGLPATNHLPIGVKSDISLEVRPKDWKLVSRVQDWRLISPDNATSVPITAKVNTTARTIELDLTNTRLKAGPWKLAANWDWDPIAVSGNVVLHDFSAFKSARLTPRSQDNLNSGAGTLDLELTGDDFEYVRKIEYRKQGDPFAQSQALPFHLPKEPVIGPETSLKVRLDAKPLATGNYVFLIAQSDGKVHEAPFKVLSAPPSISDTPMILNTGVETQTVVLHGTGLDRIEQISADDAQITLGEGGSGGERNATVRLKPQVKEDTLLTLQLKVKDFEEPISLQDAFMVGGPRPAITTVRESSQGNFGIGLNPGEMAASSLVSFEIGLLHARVVSRVDLSCENAPDSALVKVKMGEAKDELKLTRESPDTLFLLFRPESVGPPGCTVMATLITPKSGRSEPRKLAAVVLLPQIDSFQISTERAGDSLWFAALEGRDLENIAKVGWDAQSGTNVDAIPTPVAGSGNSESLRVEIPWPSPVPHAPLYIWLRGEERGRLTSGKY
jgi:hypothetical protein